MSGPRSGREGITYRDAGVDLEVADAVAERAGHHARRATRPEVVDSASGFAGLFALDRDRYADPLLVASCDGVGTKLELAHAVGRHDTVGVDLVAMVVDDLVCTGAEPLLFLDYVAAGELSPDVVDELLAGIADGCVQAGCALLGGESAAHPGVLPSDRYDLAGFGVGVVERAEALEPARVRSGDAVVAMASTGLHSNGYSLARRVVDAAGLALASDHGLKVQTLGDALLRPTRIYAPDCLALLGETPVHALCHVTGGGVPGNLARVLPDGHGALVDTTTFAVPGVFGVLAEHGPIAPEEMWRVFNMGAGMLAVVPDGAAAVDVLRARGVDAWECGEVRAGAEGVELAGLTAPGA
ncbi:phosphoribosylformylglycinamidine cyclo-ligase [Egibacter rhizosphaerae]|uniref:Phosphoribosylformylglycinamidine cyclo-ligase n=1 Tax=Egibacter rhizosphaerae TaxID=1670831 RepID=A0A411YFZ3_9ACTN|nr:phosphoribosylformylglycinamidine cyclo-ligase [Egibacter rhizosphaerae]QBI20184.1 phosphoribosylformylglycinamidine cyclo-ligase [Egibacter rhizosphaerae]